MENCSIYFVFFGRKANVWKKSKKLAVNQVFSQPIPLFGIFGNQRLVTAPRRSCRVEVGIARIGGVPQHSDPVMGLGYGRKLLLNNITDV